MLWGIWAKVGENVGGPKKKGGERKKEGGGEGGKKGKKKTTIFFDSPYRIWLAASGARRLLG